MRTVKKFFRRLALNETRVARMYILMLVMLLVFTIVSYVLPYEREGFDGHNYITLSTGWSQILSSDGQAYPIPSLPVELNDRIGEEIVIRRRLPDDLLTEGPVLFVKSNHQTVSARINGKEFFHYEYHSARRYDADFPPSKWLAIPLSDAYAGANLELSLTRLQNDGSDTVSEIFLGERADIIFLLVRRNTFSLLCGGVTFLMGLFFLVRHLLSPTRKDLGYRNLYVGLILTMLPIWMFCTSDIRQILFENIIYIRNLEFFSLMLLPVPIILSLNYSEGGRYAKTAHRLCSVIFLIDLAIMALVLLGFNLLSLLWLILLTLVLAALFVLASFWHIAATDAALFRSLRTMWHAYAFMLLLGLGEYLNMIFLASRYTGVCLSIGVLGYTIGLSIEQSHVQRRLVSKVQEVELQSRAKSEFLANMSHEIRTPINAMLGMDEMILRESKDPVILGYAADIRQAGHHLMTLINSILDISRIESGRMEIEEAGYELDALLSEISDLIRVQAEEKGLSFETKVLSVIPNQLSGDSARIRQIAINLLNNAVKYTKRGSVVFSVDAVSPEEADMLRDQALVKGTPTEIENPVYLRMSIRDTGIGIREEDLPTVFDSFRRLDTKENAGIQGTGLGLPIVSTLVRLMHGCLLVKSVYGIGTQFTVVLPQEKLSENWIGSFDGHTKQADSSSEEDPALFRAPEAKILGVDDNLLNRRLLAALLRRTQVDLTTCESGQECLELVRKERYDLILMDHLMPEMDGIETLHRLQALSGSKCAGVPVIVLTANAISGVKEQYLDAGFTDYLAKPIQSAELEKLLMRYLPPDKLLSGAADTPDAADEDASIPNQLYYMEELDVQLGLTYCGTAQTYLDTLEIYARNAASFASEIEDLYRAGSVAGTVVKVHALKSTSLAIGALELSTLAEKLEAVGKSGDTQALDAELGDLLARHRLLGQRLLPLFRQEAPHGGSPSISEKQLWETYDMIRKLTEEFNYDRAAAMIEALDRFDLPESERTRCEQLRQAADTFEWEQISDILA